MLKVNITDEGLKYHHDEVGKIFDNIILKRLGYEIDKKNNKKICKLTDEQIEFISKNVHGLITYKPNELLKLHYEFSEISKSNFVKTKIFFDYAYASYFQKNHGKKFLNKLDIHTCIYCNRNYTLDFKNLKNARAELDHWFPKSEFPILALSFYNLIPSCHSCNHIKGASKSFDWSKALDKINHPYLDKNEFVFSYFYKTFDDFKMKINVSHLKTEETLNFNKTKEIYDAHSSKELKELLDLRFKYSKNYLDILLNNTFSDLSMSKEEAYRIIFGIEILEKDYHKRPFSKFKHDIIQELLSKQ